MGDVFYLLPDLFDSGLVLEVVVHCHAFYGACDLQGTSFDHGLNAVCGVELVMLSQIHVEIGVDLEIIKVLPLNPNIKIASLDRLDDQIYSLSALRPDNSLQRLYIDIALLEVWLCDEEGAFVIAAVDQLELPAQELVGVVDIALVYLTKVDRLARHLHLHILHLAQHLNIHLPAVLDLKGDWQIDGLLLKGIQHAIQSHLALGCNSKPVQHLFASHWIVKVQPPLVTLLIIKFIKVVKLQHVETMCVVEFELYWCFLRVFED